MVSYGQYCPVAKAAEILGNRWTLLIVRDLIGGSTGFNELQRGLPGISRSVLAQRMRALERAEIVERRTNAAGRPVGYQLTAAGRDLAKVVNTIGEWDLTVRAGTEDLYRVYFGYTTLGDALHSGAVTLSGPLGLQRAFATRFAWSDMAPAIKSSDARRAAAERAGQPQRRISMA